MPLKNFSVLIFVLFLVSGCVTTGTWVTSPASRTVTADYFQATLEPLKKENDFYVSFKLTILNTSSTNIEIDWNKTMYIANGSQKGVFIFKGIEPESIRDNTVPPDTLKSGETLSREISPFRLLAGAPLKSKHKTDSKISPGMLPEGENGIWLSVKSNNKEIRKRISVSIMYLKNQENRS